jgi:hypothetical protein
MMTDKPEWFAKREIIPLSARTLPGELPPVKHPISTVFPRSCNSPEPTPLQ